MNNEIYNKLFEGVNNRRTIDGAIELKELLEGQLKIEAVYWMGLDFRYKVRIDKAREIIASYISKCNRRLLRTHIQVLLVMNDDCGKVQNDIHLIVCLMKNKSDDFYVEAMEKMQRLWNKGRKPFIQIYDSKQNGVVYATIKHNEIPLMLFCPNRGSCSDKNRHRNDCIYRKNPSLLKNK